MNEKWWLTAWFCMEVCQNFFDMTSQKNISHTPSKRNSMWILCEMCIKPDFAITDYGTNPTTFQDTSQKIFVDSSAGSWRGKTQFFLCNAWKWALRSLSTQTILWFCEWMILGFSYWSPVMHLCCNRTAWHHPYPHPHLAFLPLYHSLCDKFLAGLAK